MNINTIIVLVILSLIGWRISQSDGWHTMGNNAACQYDAAEKAMVCE